jgi:hypothetical protein
MWTQCFLLLMASCVGVVDSFIDDSFIDSNVGCLLGSVWCGLRSKEMFGVHVCHRIQCILA